MHEATLRVGECVIGPASAVFVIGEIGINHNGDLELAHRLIDAAADAGADAVKFQKRVPEKCVPRDQWDVSRDTPWGRMTYLAYRHKLELDREAYGAIDAHCRARGVAWFASCWDEESVDFLEAFSPPAYKAASAALTDEPLLRRMRATGRPLIVSTGMSTMSEIENAVALLTTHHLALAHSTSLYPCAAEQLNLRMLTTLKARFPACPIGYSGHEDGIAPTLAAVGLGARFVERHLTLDRGMWGTDQRASLEPPVFTRMVREIRELERALGDGEKRMAPGEAEQRRKLSRVGAKSAAYDGASATAHAPHSLRDR